MVQERGSAVFLLYQGKHMGHAVQDKSGIAVSALRGVPVGVLLR